MTHDEAKSLTLPTECWTTGSTPGDVWMPLPITLVKYGPLDGVRYPSAVALCRGAKGDYVTSVELILKTKAEAEADVVEDLLGSYQACIEAIADANAEMARLKQHPLWRDLP